MSRRLKLSCIIHVHQHNLSTSPGPAVHIYVYLFFDLWYGFPDRVFIHTAMLNTILTIIIVGYVLYYGYMIISDLFIKKERQAETNIEEDIDISDDIDSFKASQVERGQTGQIRYEETSVTSSAAINTGALEVDDLLAHIDAFAANGDFGILPELQADWERIDVA